jgi:hypothetical protein
MSIKMTPNISTLKLGMTDRIIGNLVSMNVEGGTTAEKDLAGDTFHALFKGPESQTPMPNERVVDHSLIWHWAKSTGAWPDLEAQARGNVASSLLARQML